MSAAVSGGLNLGKESGPESIERTAEQISEAFAVALRKQGWIE